MRLFYVPQWLGRLCDGRSLPDLRLTHPATVPRNKTSHFSQPSAQTRSFAESPDPRYIFFRVTVNESVKSHHILFRATPEMEDAARRLVRARQRSAWRTRRSDLDLVRLRRAFPTEGSMDMIRL